MKIRFAVPVIAALAMMTAVSCGNNKNTSAKSEDNSAEAAATEAVQADERGYIVKVGDQVPDFDLMMMDGTTLNIKELQGKVVMLQFTASWCGVCRKEMPHIESEIWQKLKGNPEFALYGIDLKETPEVTADFAKAIPVTYPLTLDPEGERFALFCDKGAGVTRNIILDRTGKIIMLTRLYDEAEFASMVKLINDDEAEFASMVKLINEELAK